MQQPKHFTVILEFEGEDPVTSDHAVLMLRGITKNGKRPSYMTVTCNMEEAAYVMSPNTIELIYGLVHVLKPSHGMSHRITLKPLWFHNKFYSTKG